MYIADDGTKKKRRRIQNKVWSDSSEDEQNEEQEGNLCVKVIDIETERAMMTPNSSDGTMIKYNRSLVAYFINYNNQLRKSNN